MIDFDKLRSAIVGFWNFLWPALTTTLLWCWLTYWIAPEATLKLGSALRPFLRLPDQHTRDTLTFFGVDKLIPVLTAFFVLLLIYLVGLLSDKTGDLMPPYIIYSPSELAAKLTGNVNGPRLKTHFNCTTDWEMWDRANELASGLDPQKSIAGMNVQGSNKRMWATKESWNRSKFFLVWIFFIAVVEHRVSPVHRIHESRTLFAILATFLISFFYFLKVLSTWKNSVAAILNAAQLAVVETPELQHRIAILPRPDNPNRLRSVFQLRWTPPFFWVMQPELFFNLTRLPLLGRFVLWKRRKIQDRMNPYRQNASGGDNGKT